MRGLGEFSQNRKFAPMSEIVGDGKLEQKRVKSEDYSKWKERESERVGVKVCKTGRLLQVEGRGKQAGWSRSGLNWKITPSGRKRKASGLGQKCAKPEDYSKRKKEESKRVGVKERKTGRLLQVEKRRKKKMVETRKKHMYNRDA